MSKSTFYCWVRVLPRTSPAPRYVVDERGKEDLEPDAGPPAFGMLHGNRPPKRSSVESRPGKDSDAWFIDHLEDGTQKSDLEFDYGPVYRHRQMALSWVLTRQGKEWRDEAVNYVLMSFEREAP